jgi:hypothetical protein
VRVQLEIDGLEQGSRQMVSVGVQNIKAINEIGPGVKIHFIKLLTIIIT